MLIGDFEDRTGDSVFDGVVEQALSLGIEGASFVNAFPRRDRIARAAAIKPARNSTSRREALWRFAKTRMVIVGAIEAKGSGYHISIKGWAPAPMPR